jgi:predicted ATPase
MNPSQFVRSVALRRAKVESFDQYPFCLPVVKALEQIDLHAKVTFFIGENGSRKSTLLEAIAVSLELNEKPLLALTLRLQSNRDPSRAFLSD